MMINIYINVAIMGNVNDILNDLLGKIKGNGLYESCNFIKLAINGNINILKINFHDNLNKLIFIQTSENIKQFEFPGLKLLWEDSQQSDCNILYLHTKGVSKDSDKRIHDWVNYLSYFNITKWQDRINDLKNFDCSGVNLNGDSASLLIDPVKWASRFAPVHYSGNFWWSNSKHIRKLPDPYRWIPDNNYERWRIMAEMWVCQLDGKYKSVWQSHVNHYLEPYPDYMYLDDRYSIVQRIIKRKAFLIFIILERIKGAYKSKIL